MLSEELSLFNLCDGEGLLSKSDEACNEAFVDVSCCDLPSSGDASLPDAIAARIPRGAESDDLITWVIHLLPYSYLNCPYSYNSRHQLSSRRAFE
jgi:hypothetical protein